MKVQEFVHQASLVKLHEVEGAKDEGFHGILTPGYEAGYTDNFIHDQFTSGAEAYEKFYTNHPFFKHQIERGLELGGWQDRQPNAILDIGSGAGNSVIPLVQMFPAAKIVASDLSLELLALLGKALKANGEHENVATLQLNAENIAFKEQSFDLIVGAAILHHLFYPEKAILGSAKALKKDGLAIFFEPMQGANFLIRMIYSIVLRDPRSRKLPARLQRYMGNRIKFFEDRRPLDKSDPKFLKMDDKWMFPRQYFADLAKQSGCSDYFLAPIGSPNEQIMGKMAVHMRGYGGQFEDLPDWIIDMINDFDANIPESMRQEFIGDAVVVFKK